MSKPVAVAWGETAEELEGRYRAEREVERRKRLGALWRVRAGDRVAEAGRLAGVGGRTVERWLAWYWAGGLNDVLRRRPGHGATGQPHRLTAEQRAGLLEHAARAGSSGRTRRRANGSRRRTGRATGPAAEIDPLIAADRPFHAYTSTAALATTDRLKVGARSTKAVAG